MTDLREYEELIEMAKGAAQHAYAPYSEFAVGAALMTDSGKIYTGCNIENMSYGASLCAERTAAAKAVSDGETSFVALAVYHPGADMPYPCGICRQVLAEFARRMAVITVNDRGGEIFDLKQLLPNTFEFKR